MEEFWVTSLHDVIGFGDQQTSKGSYESKGICYSQTEMFTA